MAPGYRAARHWILDWNRVPILLVDSRDPTNPRTTRKAQQWLLLLPLWVAFVL
jgi:hypothetical protein